MASDNADFLSIMQLTPDEAREYLEAQRWPNGPFCPHCGVVATPYKTTRKTKTKNRVRTIYTCPEKACRKQYTVTIGTIFEGSHIPLNKWLAGIFLMCASKKGVSSHQLHRMLKIQYKSALFMTHRIRHAMKNGQFEKLTGEVEADATYIGGKTRRGHPVTHERIRDEIEMGIRNKDGSYKRGKSMTGKPHPRTLKQAVFGMVERGGDVRTIVIKKNDETNDELRPIMLANLELGETRLLTDGHRAYRHIKADVKQHDVIDHSVAYVVGDVHTNNIEGYWSLLKRGLHGTFHSVSRHRLPHYLDEFSYRWNHRLESDEQRFQALLRQTQGRVTWYHRDPS